VEDIGANA